MVDRTQWHMIDYGADEEKPWDHFGLKAGDGVQRGVPEGTRQEWRTLIACMRDGVEFHTKRLAWNPEEGIHSPRNQEHGDGQTFLTPDPVVDAAMIEGLLNNPQPWQADHLRRKP